MGIPGKILLLKLVLFHGKKKVNCSSKIFPIVDLWSLMLQPTIDEKIQLVPKAQLGSWGKGSSGGAKASETGKYGVSLLGNLHVVY